ncbi:hypothetical protein IB285_08315 [Erythrobacter sp. KMU-140]|uniref:Uncharacterized protein n=1 Tax=Erythrobacter rubeus TaxID=2760803 RepID=A0ABR8KNM6_9SPHN|nr:hypothetical protein [Erythrobacter rubeus]
MRPARTAVQATAGLLASIAVINGKAEVTERTAPRGARTESIAAASAGPIGSIAGANAALTELNGAVTGARTGWTGAAAIVQPTESIAAASAGQTGLTAAETAGPTVSSVGVIAARTGSTGAVTGAAFAIAALPTG